MYVHMYICVKIRFRTSEQDIESFGQDALNSLQHKDLEARLVRESGREKERDI